MNDNQRFFHFYSENNGDSRPTMTVSMIIERTKDNLATGIGLGFARCCSSDTPNKKKGRAISSSRAKAALITQKTMFNPPEFSGAGQGSPKFVYIPLSDWTIDNTKDMLEDCPIGDSFDEHYDLLQSRLEASIKHLLKTNRL